MWPRFWGPPPATPAAPVEKPQPADVWCQECERWTSRDCLPGAPAFNVPDYWMCVRCGQVDWSFTPAEEEDVA